MNMKLDCHLLPGGTMKHTGLMWYVFTNIVVWCVMYNLVQCHSVSVHSDIFRQSILCLFIDLF